MTDYLNDKKLGELFIYESVFLNPEKSLVICRSFQLSIRVTEI